MSFNLSQTFYLSKSTVTQWGTVFFGRIPSYEDAIPVATTSCFMFIGKGKIRKLNRSSMNQKFSNTTGSKRVRSGKVARVRPLFSCTFTKTVSKQDDVQEPVHCETHPISCACCATFSPVSNETGMWKCSVCLVWIYCPSANQAFPTPLSSSWAPSIHARGRFHTFLSCHARHSGGRDLILVGHTAKSGFS